MLNRFWRLYYSSFTDPIVSSTSSNNICSALLFPNNSVRIFSIFLRICLHSLALNFINQFCLFDLNNLMEKKQTHLLIYRFQCIMKLLKQIRMVHPKSYALLNNDWSIEVLVSIKWNTNHWNAGVKRLKMIFPHSCENAFWIRISQKYKGIKL